MRKCAFTLLEILVVIAIIGVLTAIAAPALRSAKSRARSIQCKSNIRQLSNGFQIYQQEFDAFPYGFWDLDLIHPPIKPEGGYAGIATHDFMGLWWFNYLQEAMEFHLDPGSVVWCPAKDFTGPASKNNILCGNYGVNRLLFRDARQINGGLFFGDPFRYNAIKTPSSTFLISDSGYSLVSWMAATETTHPVFENSDRIAAFYIPGLKLNQNRPELVSQTDAIKGRHPNQTLNIAFADGHVDTVNAECLAIDPNTVSSGHIPSLWQP